MTEQVRPKRKDSLLSHCLLRATVDDLGGWEKAEAEFEAGTFKINAWMGVKATPRAMRVAAFVVLWAVAMSEEGRDSYTIPSISGTGTKASVRHTASRTNFASYGQSSGRQTNWRVSCSNS